MEPAGYKKNRTPTEHWDGQEMDRRPQPEHREHEQAPRCRSRLQHRRLGRWGVRFRTQSIILRWDGTAWSLVANSCPFALYGVTATAVRGSLADVSANSASDMWAVGTTNVDDAGVYVVAGLSPGTYDMFATKSGCDPAHSTVIVTAGVTLSEDLFVTC